MLLRPRAGAMLLTRSGGRGIATPRPDSEEGAHVAHLVGEVLLRHGLLAQAVV